MKKINLVLSFACALLVSGTASAQLVGGSVFLQGKYVEAGICANGDFGAASAPAGYHPHMSMSGGGSLGFVADPDMDGWSTGTPAYKGDFFTPGLPYEAWNMQIGSLRAQAASCMSPVGSSTIAGTNTAYTASGSTKTGTWVGMLDSVIIKQETTLDTLALYFSIRVTLTNIASVPKNDIYYVRTVDPDNDESWSGSFVTKNKIEYQMPNATNSSVVSARGTVDTTSYLAMGTTDSNAKCFILGAALSIADTANLGAIYGGTFPSTYYSLGYTTTADVGMGVAFYVNHLAPADSSSDSVAYKTTTAAAHHKHPANQKSFTMFYAFSRPAVDSAIKYLVDTATPVIPPVTSVRNVNDENNIKVYPNPARDIVNIANLEATDQVTLYDLMGKTVTWNQAGNNSYSLQGIPSGNYIITVKDAGGSIKARIPLRKQ